ncbi:MAG: ABC transporter permease [Anaerolineales bacterium]
MNLMENFRIALRALLANKLRAGLTMLGMIIGVGSVVSLMALGNGATASITSQVQGMGSNLITIAPASVEEDGQTTFGVLYLDDYEALLAGLSQVGGLSPVLESGFTVTQGKETLETTVTATTPDYASVNAFEVERGRFLTTADRDRAARVAVIGSQTATDLFHGLDPVGRTLRINGNTFAVVGVLVEKPTGGFGNANELILVPLETAYGMAGSAALRNGRPMLNSIQLAASNSDVIDSVIVQTERILRREHSLGLTEKLDFGVFSQAQILDTLGFITATLTTFLGAIAGISLLVGGIGIMNIMLVSVTERTKEIGLRKAVGATRSVILTQFLVETLVLSILGGMLGLAFGYGVALAVSLADLIPAKVTWDSVLLAVGFSIAVGLFFGIYPAWRAAGLRPIEALRYE